MIFCLFPFYWLINTSLKTGADLSTGKIYPPHPNLDNYSSIFRNSDFTDALRNSAIISITTTAIALVIGSFAAYALARLRFPMKFLLLGVIFVWNEFLFAITLTSSASVRPVPAAIAFFTGSSQFEIPLGTISAASVVVTVPLIMLVLIFQKRIVAGLTAGAVKG